MVDGLLTADAGPSILLLILAAALIASSLSVISLVRGLSLLRVYGVPLGFSVSDSEKP